jgi:teichuronic acid biosynthesis glycosyltransferase TuaC
LKILFVSSGNAKTPNGISPIVYAQGRSLIEKNISVKFFGISGKGIVSYLRTIPKIRKQINEFQPDVVHAHYSLSGFAASLAGAKPLVVSLMGSDVKEKGYFKFLIYFFYSFCWKKTIVKSEDMKQSLGFTKLEVLPNGVNISIFSPRNKKECQRILGWDVSKHHILFAANPDRYEKNFQLASDAYHSLSVNGELHSLNNIPAADIPIYMNAADVVFLTSLWEGSPNVIKEAMACARPIVTTNVGDVTFLLKDVNEAYICDFDKSELGLALIKALEYSKLNAKTNGDIIIKQMALDSDSVAERLLEMYNEVI